MTTTLAEPVATPSTDQYLYLDDVDWSFYEMFLTAADTQRLQITYDQGKLEIMSPLPRHERLKTLLGTMIQLLALEHRIPVDGLGSTTFRRQMLSRGLEPDECFYIQNYSKVWKKDDLDLEVDPPPDLVIEVENTRRILKRLPIYAALGFPEVWRHDGLKLAALKLENGAYQPTEASLAFPSLKVADLNQFLDRARIVQNDVLLEQFRDWLRR